MCRAKLYDASQGCVSSFRIFTDCAKIEPAKRPHFILICVIDFSILPVHWLQMPDQINNLLKSKIEVIKLKVYTWFHVPFMFAALSEWFYLKMGCRTQKILAVHLCFIANDTWCFLECSYSYPVSPPAQSPALARRGPKLRSGEEPGSNTPNFSSSVNKNGEDDNDQTFWGHAQQPQATCGIFHGVPGHCAGQLRRLTMFLNILSHQRTQGS